MGNLLINRNISSQVIINDFFNRQNAQCIAWNTSDITGATIIVNKSRVRNIEIVAQGEADLGCTINQQINTSVTSQLVSQSMQVADTDSGMFQLFHNVEMTYNNQSQSLYNNVTNISNSTCGAINQSGVDDGLIIANEVRGGRIGIGTDGSASASCNISNMISLEAYNQGVTTSDQTSTIEAGFGGLIVMIVMLIILIVIIIVIAGVAKKMFAKPPPEPPQPEPGSLEAELAML